MINNFSGEYEFLSNFSPCNMAYKGYIFKSSEAAFQACKCRDPLDMINFTKLSAKESKKLGRSILLREDWEDVKIPIMKDIVYTKFKQNFDICVKLVETGDEYLEEGNTWNDKFWGVCNGDGKNILGIILMDIREIFTKKFKKEIPEWDSEHEDLLYTEEFEVI